MPINDIDTWRKGHMAIAEWVDAWRIIPRGLVAAYGVVMWKVITWYMNLTPYMLEGCDIQLLKDACLIEAPSTQHAALVTAVVGISAAVFGLYSNSGRKWNGFTHWGKHKTEPKVEQKTEAPFSVAGRE